MGTLPRNNSATFQCRRLFSLCIRLFSSQPRSMRVPDSAKARTPVVARSWFIWTSESSLLEWNALANSEHIDNRDKFSTLAAFADDTAGQMQALSETAYAKYRKLQVAHAKALKGTEEEKAAALKKAMEGVTVEKQDDRTK